MLPHHFEFWCHSRDFCIYPFHCRFFCRTYFTKILITFLSQFSESVYFDHVLNIIRYSIFISSFRANKKIGYCIWRIRKTKKGLAAVEQHLSVNAMVLGPILESWIRGERGRWSVFTGYTYSLPSSLIAEYSVKLMKKKKVKISLKNNWDDLRKQLCFIILLYTFLL